MSDLVIVSDSNGYYKLRASKTKRKKIEADKKEKLYLIIYKMLITSILLWWRRVIQLLWPLLLLIRSKYNYLEYISVLLHFEWARIRKKVQKFHKIMAVIILLMMNFLQQQKKGIEICKKRLHFIFPLVLLNHIISFIAYVCIYY